MAYASQLHERKDDRPQNRESPVGPVTRWMMISSGILTKYVEKLDVGFVAEVWPDALMPRVQYNVKDAPVSFAKYAPAIAHLISQQV